MNNSQLVHQQKNALKNSEVNENMNILIILSHKSIHSCTSTALCR